ncbi:MAG: alpha-L-fucosidase, partial [Lentisphaeria bacterium]
MQDGNIAGAYLEFIKQIELDNPEVVDARGAHEGTPVEAIANREERMQWWRDGKIGMFIHYGLYSGMAGESKGKVYNGCVEWIQDRTGMDTDAYLEEAMPLFVPKTGKAEEWVKLAKDNGFCYTVLTSRHHEGYNMFNTKHSDFNVYKTKGVDIIKEYAAACEKYDVKAGYYLSMIDWNHPDYDPRGSGVSYPRGCWEMEKQGRRTFGNHEKYKEYLYNICDDLFSQYKVDLVWWDYSQPRFQGDQAWGATRLMQSLFKHHPMAIQNNRLYHSDNHAHEGGIKVTPHWKGDYSTAEHHIPGTGIPGDWEACQTLNGSWGYSKHNQNWKSSNSLIREIINTVSRGGNYLLNIGPTEDGSIPPQSIVIFNEIGAWLKKNGEGIYGTRYNPLGMEMSWGRATRKGDDKTYLFVFNKPANNKLAIP